MTKKQLEERISELEKQCKELKDENDSLWHLLDEIKQSDISQHQELLSKEVQKVFDEKRELFATKVEEA
tara:strand:+ start:43 stop:249 length:207 start_codon:yes stop_codon:yes gene_type:complete